MLFRSVEVLCGKTKYPADFLVLGSAATKTCPIIFGRHFLHTCGAVIDCKKEKILTKFDGESYEFNFSKFAKVPYELYKEIMHEIGPCELEDIDVAIQLANRETLFPIGIVRDVEVLCGKTKYPADFLVLGSAASKTCPIIFGKIGRASCRERVYVLV